MDVVITAHFDEEETAALAASVLGAAGAGGAAAAVTRPPAGHGTAMAALGRPLREDAGADYLVQVRCAAAGEAAAVRELAALGARKISVRGDEKE
mgnify:FL=1